MQKWAQIQGSFWIISLPLISHHRAFKLDSIEEYHDEHSVVINQMLLVMFSNITRISLLISLKLQLIGLKKQARNYLR